VLQSLKSGILGLNLSFNNVEVVLIALLKNEKTITKYDSIFIKFVKYFESLKRVLVVFSFDEAYLLFAISDTGNKTIFIRFICIYDFVVFQKLIIT